MPGLDGDGNGRTVPSPPAGRGPAAPFVSRFLLPLVKGGALHVGRPLGARAIASLLRTWQPAVRSGFSSIAELAEEDAVTELARLRQARARALIHAMPTPPLDEVSLRLGVATHNLLALGHPGLGAGLGGGRGGERRQEQIVASTLPIADLGPPPTAEEAVRRHSLLARIAEITRTEHTVDYWAGRRRFVGQAPPAALLALPRVRRVSSTSLRKVWFKEIGVPVCGRPLWIAILRASPLGEALDPLRLDPPLAWERILPVLRFAPLCRLVTGNLLELGLESAGGSMVAALLRFMSMHASAGATPEAVAFAVKLLGHAFWLQHLFRPDETIAGASDLAALLVAAAEVEPSLIWPADVPASSVLFEAFRARLDRLSGEVHARIPERLAAAVGVCRFAAAACAAVPLL